MTQQGFTLEELKARGGQMVTPVGGIDLQTGQVGPVRQTQPAPEKDQGFLKKTASVLDTIFGGGKVGEAIGTAAARGTFGQTAQRILVGRDLSPEEEAQVGEGPSGREIVGSALQSAATVTPVGRIARGVQAAGRALGIGRGVSRVAGNVVAGGTAGAGFDIGERLQGRDTGILNTTVGASIPLVGPIFAPATRAFTRISGRLAGEVTGALTGTSQETVEQALNAVRRGSQKEVDTFTKALRQETTPEQLVTNVRDAVSTVNRSRQVLFKETLKEFGDVPVNTAPVRDEALDVLQEFGIQAKGGVLDFSNSKLRTVPAAQNKVQRAFEEVLLLGEDSALRDVDTTRQALQALKLAGEDPSANAANALIDAMKDSVRSAGQQVPEYKSLLSQFAETSEFLDELERGISSGNKKTVDQTYRRIATSLKTNNEQRKMLVEELDRMTDGAILSEVAGQQLSEIMPRSIIRPFIAGGIMSGAVFGTFSQGMLPGLILASPRVIGETVRALGLGARKTDEIIESINIARKLLSETYGVSENNLIKLIAPANREE